MTHEHETAKLERSQEFIACGFPLTVFRNVADIDSCTRRGGQRKRAGENCSNEVCGIFEVCVFSEMLRM